MSNQDYEHEGDVRLRSTQPFGRKIPAPTWRELERKRNQKAACAFAGISIACFAAAFWLDQPVFALAAFIFLTTAVIVAKDA